MPQRAEHSSNLSRLPRISHLQNRRFWQLCWLLTWGSNARVAQAMPRSRRWIFLGCYLWGRSIVSCVGGPFDRIAYLLNIVLAQLSWRIPFHLTNTQNLFETSNAQALQAIFEHLAENHFKANLMDLLKCILWPFYGSVFRKGSHMVWKSFRADQRLSYGIAARTTLAIAFISGWATIHRIECSVLM